MPREKYEKPLSVSAFLVKISNVDFIFTSAEGGDLEISTGEYFDPSDRTRKKIKGTRAYTDLVLGAPYSPKDFAPVEALLRDLESGVQRDIAVTIQGIDDTAQQLPVGSPRNLQGCNLIGVKYPTVDAMGTDAAMVEITLSVDAMVQSQAA